jgi:hypothetical protein
MKGGVEAPPRDKLNNNNNINCHEKYKNTGHMTIILRES